MVINFQVFLFINIVTDFTKTNSLTNINLESIIGEFF